MDEDNQAKAVASISHLPVHVQKLVGIRTILLQSQAPSNLVQEYAKFLTDLIEMCAKSNEVGEVA